MICVRNRAMKMQGCDVLVAESAQWSDPDYWASWDDYHDYFVIGENEVIE